MATVTLKDSGVDSTPTASKTSNAFTPTAGALLVVGTTISGHSTFDAGGCTSSLTGYDFFRSEAHARSVSTTNSVYMFIANQPAKATSQTVTINAGSDAGDGFAWVVWEVSGSDVQRFGWEAIRGSGIQNNGGAGATPTVTLLGSAGTAQAALTTNVCLFVVGNGTNPIALTPPTSFAEDFDSGYATPTTGFGAWSRASGHTANSIAAGSTSATVSGSVAVEVDVTTTQTIRPVSSGTLPSGTGTGTGTTSCAPDYPPDLLEGDLITLTLSIKPSTATAPDLSAAGFTTQTNATGGTGATGLDVGTTRLATYTRVAGPTPPTGTETITPGSSPNCCWAHMRAYRSTFGTSSNWSVANTTGDDTTAGAAVSTAFGADPGIAIGDFLEVSFGTPTDVNLPGNFTRKYNANNITGTGLDNGASKGSGPTSVGSTYWEPSTSQGNDLGGLVTRWAPVAALTSGVPTFAATATGTTTNIAGPTALLRLRVASRTSLLLGQTVTPYYAFKR